MTRTTNPTNAKRDEFVSRCSAVEAAHGDGLATRFRAYAAGRLVLYQPCRERSILRPILNAVDIDLAARLTIARVVLGEMVSHTTEATAKRLGHQLTTMAGLECGTGQHIATGRDAMRVAALSAPYG